MMAAGFQCDVQSRPTHLVCRQGQSVYFRMFFSEALMPTFAHHLLVAHQHSTDERIRLDMSPAPLGQFQGTPHRINGVHAVLLGYSVCLRGSAVLEFEP